MNQNDKTMLIKINGYNNLDSQMDHAFEKLYEIFLTRIIDLAGLDTLINETFPVFQTEAIEYFKRLGKIEVTQDTFINNFTPISNHFVSIYQYALAQRFWEHIIDLITTIEYKFSTRIHKGAILYYWGGIAIINGELDKGYMLMHSALEEDIATHNNLHPGTPAERFVYFDYLDPRQYFLEVLKEQGEYLESYLHNYNLLPVLPYSIELFRDNFLSIHPKPESIFLFSYTISRLVKLCKSPNFTKNNPFTGIVDLNIIFDLILIIDSSIQARSPVGWKFFNLARYLSDAASLDLTQVRLESINDGLNLPGNFSIVVNQLINRSYPLPDGHSLSRLGTDIAIAFCFRNHAAHNISTQSLTPSNTDLILQSLFNVIFLTAQVLY